MTTDATVVTMDPEKYQPSEMIVKDREIGLTHSIVDKAAERAYGAYTSNLNQLHWSNNATVRKLDLYLLPFLSLMYFFNSVDRSNLGNAKTDGMD